ncbi:MAG: class I SAM-dependent methyltransferase [Actinomycetota bacterium]
MLGVSEAIAYWDQRHQKLDELRSGGDTGFDFASNEIFYALRLGRLIDAIGDQNSLTEPRFILDAGCGKGYFSEAMAKFGHQITGIDSSAQAIKECQRTGKAKYSQSLLSEWKSLLPYDVVYSVDVLFHLLDEEVWQKSVLNLASLVRLAGTLILADWSREERRQFGNHQLVRPPSAYLKLLSAHGFRFDRFLPYDFRDSPVGFHIFTRVY